MSVHDWLTIISIVTTAVLVPVGGYIARILRRIDKKADSEDVLNAVSDLRKYIDSTFVTKADFITHMADWPIDTGGLRGENAIQKRARERAQGRRN